MPILIQDLKLALRQLWRRPVFTLTAVLTLAIGMGVNAVAFTRGQRGVVQGVGRPRRGGCRPHRDDPGGDEGGNASLAEFQRFADATRGALEVAAEGRLSIAWRHDGTTETAWVLFVSANYFSMVDAQAIAGRVEVGRATGRAAVCGDRRTVLAHES